MAGQYGVGQRAKKYILNADGKLSKIDAATGNKKASAPVAI
ncbi:MAG: hypothetical protein R2822_29485 [Spirosomataceae bacterium]